MDFFILVGFAPEATSSPKRMKQELCKRAKKNPASLGETRLSSAIGSFNLKKKKYIKIQEEEW